MAIISETFSRVVLSDQDAARFLRHVSEDAPNPKAKASYQRGKDVLRHVLHQQMAAVVKNL